MEETVIFGVCPECKKNDIIVYGDNLLYCINCNKQIPYLEDPPASVLENLLIQIDLEDNVSKEHMDIYEEMLKETQEKEAERKKNMDPIDRIAEELQESRIGEQKPPSKRLRPN
jgi:regulator of sigma D